MIKSKSRAQRRNGIGKSGLVHGNDVGVALAHNGDAGSGNGFFGPVVRKKVLSLIKNYRISCIEVFGGIFRLSKKTSAKSDCPTPLVMNGKHDAPIKPIRGAPSSINGKVGGNHFLMGKAQFSQVRDKRSSSRRIPKIPPLANVSAKTTPGKIAARGGKILPFTPHKHEVEEIIGRSQTVKKPLLSRTFRILFLLRKRNAGSVC